MSYFGELFTSDIQMDDLDRQLAIWVTQLLENAIESNATNIEVRFLKMGAEGFDVIDNGAGVHETDFPALAKTLPNRESNSMYKSRSLGYQGEALYSLVKSSAVTIYTRHKDEKHGWKLTFDKDCDIATKIKIEKPTSGTTIEVRDVHRINARAAFSYKKYIKEHNDHCTRIMSTYSMIMWNRGISLTF